MKSLFSVNTLLCAAGYALNFFLFLALFTYFSVDHTLLARGSLPPDGRSFYLPLTAVYWAVILVSWLYYAFYTTYLASYFARKRVAKIMRYQYYQLLDWCVDAAIIYAFMAFCVVMNYIAYYPGDPTAYQIVRHFILNNPVFYGSLAGILLGNCGIYLIYVKFAGKNNRKEMK